VGVTRTNTLTVDTRIGPLPCRVHGEGTPVLASHGLLVDGRLWAGVAGALGPDVRLIAPDLPLGAHWAPVPDRAALSASTVADALVDLLDGLGIDRAVAIGNDTGGALTQVAVGRQPRRFAGLVLTSCDALDHFPPPLLRPLTACVGWPGAVRAVAWLFGRPRLFSRPGRLNLLCARPVERALVESWLAPVRRDPGVRADLVAFVRTVGPALTQQAAEDLAGFPGPTVIAWSRRDRLFPAADARRLARRLPGAELTWIDDALTFSPLDQPAAVAGAVRSVLDRIPASESAPGPVLKDANRKDGSASTKDDR
jgi:pimeloyl-ACP methyl ester carboxylesterase